MPLPAAPVARFQALVASFAACGPIGAAGAANAAAIPTLRPVRQEDLPAMRRFVQALSPASRRLRFHGGLKPDSDRLLQHLTGADGVRHVAWVAVRPCDDGDAIVGEARWVRTGEGTAELAIAIADAWQGRGLARPLLSQLLRAADSAGVATLTADVLAGNDRMAALLQREGFSPGRPEGAAAEAGVRTWVKSLPVRAARGMRPPAPGWRVLAGRLLRGWASLVPAA